MGLLEAAWARASRCAAWRAALACAPVSAAAPASRTRLGLSWAASLHGKVFLADGQRLFMGSFNLHPRSANLNSEMGLVIDSPTLTRELAQRTEGLL